MTICVDCGREHRLGEGCWAAAESADDGTVEISCARYQELTDACKLALRFLQTGTISSDRERHPYELWMRAVIKLRKVVGEDFWRELVDEVNNG